MSGMIQLLQLISAYQKNPGTETYQAVQKFFTKTKNKRFRIHLTIQNIIQLICIFYITKIILLWSTSPLVIQDKIVLLYQASEYSSQATQGSSYKKLEDESEFSLSWVSGTPIFFKGGALKIGTTTETATPDSCPKDGFIYCLSTFGATCCSIGYECDPNG